MGAVAEVQVDRPESADDVAWVVAACRTEWGGDVMISGGRTVAFREAEALIARAGHEKVGLLTYVTGATEWELLSVNAFARNVGVGTALLERVKQLARAAGVSKLWTVTSNDNLEALRFYQRRGFRLVSVEVGAVDAARRQKPTIPLVGCFGIPLHDELRLELGLYP